jgi:prepilin-type N-terminal cleavage/methylation domain-containing protein
MKTKAFTLIETMVAVTILTLSIAGPLFTASRAIVAAQIAKDQLIASYLAQEGIEYVRAVRDNAYLAAYNTPNETEAWNNFLTAMSQCNATSNSAVSCTLDPLTNTLAPFSGNAELYLTNTTPKIYTQIQSGNVKTAFTRTIKVLDISTTEERIVSNVSWNFHANAYSVTINDHLTSWQ